MTYPVALSLARSIPMDPQAVAFDYVAVSRLR
jgi:hypothetical protein